MVRKRYVVRFRVSPDSLTWLVECEGEVLSRHCRKRDAVREAAGRARTTRPSVLVIHRIDGTRSGERRYGRDQ
ncbi:uncharacterized protein DUF2188 [Prauserella shujinwangii]|uniref:Uncharacterized protein DUF2188 n=1 Tax=Prauserella shujinwangii TaxID=1453103 RepID=A0A2T0LPV6_9PSEU|nr:DUF2188 domain-containing protein [Prauserella shujinwangii]PRX45359.1 uncharacterized protein DUF2188 [Prauserella shujinwangii]